VHRESRGAAVTSWLLVALVGCARMRLAAPESRPLPSRPTTCAATKTPLPTRTSQPAATPLPTQTPRPTATPRPPEPPSPKDTAWPSATPTSTPEPTATFTPTPRDTATPTVELTSIGSITPDHIGEDVTVQGAVIEATSFSHGFKFTLDDGQGQVVLLMWHDIYDACWDRAKINLGATVRVAGQITQYEGQLQIEPQFGGDVSVWKAAGVSASRREIDSISAADTGKRVMVEGAVVRTEGLASAVKVFLRGDGPADQGEILVFIWRNVLDRIVDNVGLGTVGSRVRVVGRVQVYQSNLEIVPALPNDVTVLEIP